MKIATSPNCTLCSLNQTGTFLHVMWECPTVHAFWREVAGSLSELFQLEINSTPQSMLLDNDSDLQLGPAQRQVWLSASTVAKRMMAVRWKPPHSLSIPQWIQSLVVTLAMELAAARVGRSGERAIYIKKEALELAKALL